VIVEGEELGAIARRIIDSNQFITIGTAGEEGVPRVSPAWYALAEYREFFWVSDPEARHPTNIAASQGANRCRSPPSSPLSLTQNDDAPRSWRRELAATQSKENPLWAKY
jgi:hypothetical protein